MARYRSCPAVSQICALIVLPSTCKAPPYRVTTTLPLPATAPQLGACKPARRHERGWSGARLDAASGKFDADGGLGLQAELIAGEAAEQVGLAHARVAYEDHLEQVVVAAPPAPAPVTRVYRRHTPTFPARAVQAPGLGPRRLPLHCHNSQKSTPCGHTRPAGRRRGALVVGLVAHGAGHGAGRPGGGAGGGGGTRGGSSRGGVAPCVFDHAPGPGGCLAPCRRRPGAARPPGVPGSAGGGLGGACARGGGGGVAGPRGRCRGRTRAAGGGAGPLLLAFPLPSSFFSSPYLPPSPPPACMPRLGRFWPWLHVVGHFGRPAGPAPLICEAELIANTPAAALSIAKAGQIQFLASLSGPSKPCGAGESSQEED